MGASKIHLLGDLTYLKRDFLIVEVKEKTMSDGLGIREWFVALSMKDYIKHYSNRLFGYTTKDEKECNKLGYRTKKMTNKDHKFFKENRERFFLGKIK